MSLSDIKDYITSVCSHLTFGFCGKACGIDPISLDHIDMWCGDDTATATSIDDAMRLPLFDGKSLQEIIEEIENIDT